MKKRVTAFLALGMTISCLLTGCGGTNDKTEEGMQQISALQYANALVLFDEAEEAGENARLIARGRGIAYLSQADYSNAVKYFLEALKLSDGFVQDIDYDINYYLGDAYIGLSDYESAENVYTSILELKKEAQAYYLRGIVRLYSGEFTLAASDFNDAIALEPKNVDMIIHIYNALDENGYHDAGIDYLQKAIDNADKSMTPLNRGKIYYYIGDYQTAAGSLEEARNLDNNNSEASLYLGKAYEAVGEYNYASNVYESYLARNPKDAALYNQLALCRMKLGNYEAALESIQNGMQAGDSRYMKSLSYNEIVVYEYLGEFQKAEALMRNYLENYPSDEKAQREQIFLETR